MTDVDAMDAACLLRRSAPDADTSATLKWRRTPGAGIYTIVVLFTWPVGTSSAA